jgi:predicted esterase
MLGSTSAEGSFSEAEADGGPFCISFHKSEGDMWDDSCDKNDADHFKDFIPWILDEFPSVNPEAIFLHGYSSGAVMINTLMFASCEVERYISGAAPYAGLTERQVVLGFQNFQIHRLLVAILLCQQIKLTSRVRALFRIPL